MGNEYRIVLNDEEDKLARKYADLLGLNMTEYLRHSLLLQGRMESFSTLNRMREILESAPAVLEYLRATIKLGDKLSEYFDSQSDKNGL